MPHRDMGGRSPITSPREGPEEHRLPTANVGGVAMLHHRASDVLFLPRHGVFSAGKVHRYDQRGLNISVRYAGGTSAIASIYVFPFDPPRTRERFDNVFESSVDDMLSTVSGARAVTRRLTAFARAAGDVVPGRRCEAAADAWLGSSRPCHALVELFAHGSWLLKIRATCPAASRAELEGFLDAWLAASTFGAR